MTNMATVEIKAFVPAKDFDLSKRFPTGVLWRIGQSIEDAAEPAAAGDAQNART